MAVPTNSGESDMATEDFCLNLSPFLSPMWSQLCLTPSPPRSFLPSSSSMVMQYQGSNQSMDHPPQNQEHDDIVDQALYLTRDSALLQQLRKNWSEASDWRPRGGGIMRMNNQGFEESNMGFEKSEEMTTCFNFPPSPTNFPLYRAMPSVFFVSSEQENISLALSYQHILEDKSGALHVLYGEEVENILGLLLFPGYKSYMDDKSDGLDQIARAAGVWPEDMESLVENIWDADTDEIERTLRRINRLEQHDEDIVDLPVFELVAVVHQLIQNRGGELDVILGGGVFEINGLECSNNQGSPTTPETLLICQAKLSSRVWLGHGGQWAAEIRYRCNRLNIGSFTTVEDAVSAYEVVLRWSGWEDLTRFPGLFENQNRSKLLLQLPPPAQEEKPSEYFGVVSCNATGNDEIEAVGTDNEGIGDCVMRDQDRLNSRCLRKRKTKGKNLGGERRNKKTNEVRIEILSNNILQTEGMSLKDAANHLEAEAVGKWSGGTGQSDMEEGQLNSRYLGREKTKEMTPGGEGRNKKNAISLEDILRCKEMPQKVAAKHLKVSLSTLKRACRGHGIPIWPPCGEHNQSRPNESPAVVDKEQIPQLKSDMLLPSNQVSTTTGTKSVTMKARFGKHTIKFQLSWPFRTEELKQQVKKRLELEAGIYYINYKDEDNDDILIGCDEDLQDHISRSSIPGTNSIEVFLQPK